MKIKEDLKRAIMEYLEDKTAQKSAEDLVLSKIAEEVKDDPERVEEALDDLESEKSVARHDIKLEVFLPKTGEGRKKLETLAKRKILTSSPYVAIIIALVVLFLIIPYLELKLPTNVEIDTLLDAFLQGVRSGIVYSGLVGLIGGYIIQNIFSRYLRWKAISIERHEVMMRIVKNAIYMTVGVLIIYWFLLRGLGYEVSLAVITILLNIVTIVVTYIFSKERRDII